MEDEIVWKTSLVFTDVMQPIAVVLVMTLGILLGAYIVVRLLDMLFGLLLDMFNLKKEFIHFIRWKYSDKQKDGNF